MDIKKFYFGEFINYGKHNSSYFNIPAGLMVVIAFLLPGFLGILNINFAYFTTLVMIANAIFEKKSNKGKFYCFQVCYVSLFFNFLLRVLSMIGHFIIIVKIIGAMLSIVISVIMVFVYIYSIYNALQYRAWKMPWISEFVLRRVMKVND